MLRLICLHYDSKESSKSDAPSEGKPTIRSFNIIHAWPRLQLECTVGRLQRHSRMHVPIITAIIAPLNKCLREPREEIRTCHVGSQRDHTLPHSCTKLGYPTDRCLNISAPLSQTPEPRPLLQNCDEPRRQKNTYNDTTIRKCSNPSDQHRIPGPRTPTIVRWLICVLATRDSIELRLKICAP